MARLDKAIEEVLLEYSKKEKKSKLRKRRAKWLHNSYYIIYDNKFYYSHNSAISLEKYL